MVKAALSRSNKQMNEWVFVCSSIVLLFCMMQSASAATIYPYKYTDALGRNVIIAAQPDRVVSLSPAITETIWMLGAGASQIGRTEFCDYPSEAKKVKSVGGIVNASVESIALLEPDLVLAHQGVPKELVVQLDKLNISIATFKLPKTLTEILEQTGDIGILLGKNDTASDFIVKKTDVCVKRRALREIGSLWKPRVYIGGHSAPYITAGKGTFIDDLITMSGGVNIATMNLGGLRSPWQTWPQLSAEQILIADPDVIVVLKRLDTKSKNNRSIAYDGCEFTALNADPILSNVTAVRKKRVYILDENTVLRPGPRIFDALNELVKFIDEARKD